MDDVKKTVVAVLNPGESPADNGRTIHALKLAQSLSKAGSEVVLVFEGQGVQWLPRFLDRGEESHPFVKHYAEVFDSVRPLIKACNMCCKRFDTHARLSESDIPIVGEGSAHIDIGRFVLDGFQVINH